MSCRATFTSTRKYFRQKLNLTEHQFALPVMDVLIRAIPKQGPLWHIFSRIWKCSTDRELIWFEVSHDTNMIFGLYIRLHPPLNFTVGQNDPLVCTTVQKFLLVHRYLLH